MTLAEAAWEIAGQEIASGVREVPRGSNDGPRVREYLASVGLPPGSPWCAAAVSWCVLRAVEQVGGPPVFRGSGSALGLVRANPGLVIRAPAGQPCVAVHADADGVHGHAFLVNGATADGQYVSREGNTTDDGSREGWLYLERSRAPAEIAHYLRIG